MTDVADLDGSKQHYLNNTKAQPSPGLLSWWPVNTNQPFQPNYTASVPQEIPSQRHHMPSSINPVYSPSLYNTPDLTSPKPFFRCYNALHFQWGFPVRLHDLKSSKSACYESKASHIVFWRRFKAVCVSDGCWMLWLILKTHTPDFSSSEVTNRSGPRHKRTKRPRPPGGPLIGVIFYFLFFFRFLKQVT